MPADELEGQVEGWMNFDVNLYPVTDNKRWNTVNTKHLLETSNVLLSKISASVLIHIYMDSHQNMLKRKTTL